MVRCIWKAYYHKWVHMKHLVSTVSKAVCRVMHIILCHILCFHCLSVIHSSLPVVMLLSSEQNISIILGPVTTCWFSQQSSPPPDTHFNSEALILKWRQRVQLFILAYDKKVTIPLKRINFLSNYTIASLKYVTCQGKKETIHRPLNHHKIKLF